uniref:Sodium-dependent phosphate transporter n=1 Tax=Riptortus pedestris TaxID=329032 RepID=R4WKT5_RIPPE|nr:sodium-dependent phosphate transporter [Riptortus pedestris]
MEKIELSNVPPEKKKHGGMGVRHFQAGLVFFGLVVSYIQRLNLSVAVVGMMTSKKNRVDLTPETKALVLSGMFWGYSVLQVPAGAIGRRGYAVKLFAIGNFASGAISLLIPLAAQEFGYVGIFVLRFILGILQGSIYPNMSNLMANWAIPQEKEPMLCIVQSGVMFGSLISMTLSGYVGYHYDWPSIFYVSGLIGTIGGIIQYFLGADGPDSCKSISEEERDYMRICFQADNKEVQQKRGDVPWKKILTSGPVIALTITMWCACWCTWTIITLTPTYINGVLRFNLQDDGLLSSLPYLCCCITSISLTFISGMLKRKTSISESFLRPFWNSLAMYGVGASLLVLAYAPVTTTLAVGMLTTAVGINAAGYLGHGVNILDLSPNYAGVIMSISNSVANIASLLGPLISTYLIKDTSDPNEWRIVFTTSAMISFIGNTIFVFWSTTEKQPWDEESRRSSKVA